MYKPMAVCVSVILFGMAPAFAGDITSPRADNSKINQRDQNSDELTAGQQSGSKSDVEISRTLRKELIKDKKLSTYAQNVKIITQDGVITLKGPVRSQAEKNVIEYKASKVAGCRHVENEMDVAPKL